MFQELLEPFHIVPGLVDLVLVAQEERWMVCGEERRSAVAGQHAPDPGDPLINAEQRVVGMAAEGADDLRVDELELREEIMLA